jgi:hypothetical protein
LFGFETHRPQTYSLRLLDAAGTRVFTRADYLGSFAIQSPSRVSFALQLIRPPHVLSGRRSRRALWSAAFVNDTPISAQAALEILEFANSQLLELRYFEQSSMARGQFLELTIVLILVFELVLIVLGVMQ